MVKERQIDCDLLIIGSGLSGMCAAYFAAANGLSTVQVSKHTTLGFHSGLLDIAEVASQAATKSWNSPLSAVREIIKHSADHPYSKVAKNDLMDSLSQIIGFLKQEGLDYSGSTDQNLQVLTSMGTLKKSCFVPSTMQACVDAYVSKKPSLIIDIKGLRGFSSRQIVETIKEKWPTLTSARIEFPGFEGYSEVSAEHMAWALENEKNLMALIETIKPHLNGAAYVGLPAILGILKTGKILKIMVEKLGVPVFEIPSMPPSIPGLRLKEAFERGLQRLGVLRFHRQLIETIERAKDGVFHTGWDKDTGSVRIRSKGVILATGRFLGKGLIFNNGEVKESLFNLPVAHLEQKQNPYRIRFFNPQGHEINRVGIETDCGFRPLNKNLKPVFNNLFSIGIINAHQDWAREKSGSGIAVSSAYQAVQTFIDDLAQAGLCQPKARL